MTNFLPYFRQVQYTLCAKRAQDLSQHNTVWSINQRLKCVKEKQSILLSVKYTARDRIYVQYSIVQHSFNLLKI